MVMLTDPKLRSQVDTLWDKLWSGGLSNPLDAIEQLSFLLFLKQLDEREQDAERAAKRRGKKFDAAVRRAQSCAGPTGASCRPTRRSSTSRRRSSPSSRSSAAKPAPSASTWRTPSSRSTSPAC